MRWQPVQVDRLTATGLRTCRQAVQSAACPPSPCKLEFKVRSTPTHLQAAAVVQ